MAEVRRDYDSNDSDRRSESFDGPKTWIYPAAGKTTDQPMLAFHVAFVALLVGVEAFFTGLSVLNVRYGETCLEGLRLQLPRSIDGSKRALAAATKTALPTEGLLTYN